MVHLLRDYLRKKAKFSSPSPSNESNDLDFPEEINELEVAQIEKGWKPVVAQHDSNLVDALLKFLDDTILDRWLPFSEKRLDRYFQRFADHEGMEKTCIWTNGSKYEARVLVDGAVDTLRLVMNSLEYPISGGCNVFASDFASKVDKIISTSEDENMLVTVEAPRILDEALRFLNKPSFILNMVPGRPLGEKIIIKACLAMSSHKARWLALTSHEKWVFLQLHDNIPEPYVTYSNVECQADNTRPFRALLAMMLATESGFSVESEADISVPLPLIEDEDETPRLP